MAIFNPDVPQGNADMPNYLKYSKPISSIEADKSTGVALEGLGKDIEQGASLATTTAHDIINKDVRDTVDPIREDFSHELETIKQNQLVAKPVQTVTGSQALTLAQGDTDQPPPVAITQGIDKVQSIQSAMENGKVNDTYYDLRLKAAVTDLRSKYPGFVDYIDQKVSSITGINPANAYIQNLMQDINRAAVNKKTEVDKAVEEAMKSGYPNSDKMIEALQSRGETFLPAYRDWYAKQTMYDSGLKRQEAQRKSSDASKADLKDGREKDFTNEVGAAIGNNMNTVLTLSGMDKPMSVQQILTDAQNNPGKYSDDQMREFATRILAQKTVVTNQLRARAASLTGMDGSPNKDALGRTYSYNSDIGPEKTESIIKQIGGYYDAIHDSLMNGGEKGAGLAFFHMQHAAGMLSTDKDRIYAGPSGQDLRTFKIIQDDMGPNWSSMVTSDALRADVDTRLRTLFENNFAKAKAQPDTKDPVQPKPYTFKDMEGQAMDLERQGQITRAMHERYSKNFTRIVDDITSKDAPDQAKVNALKFFFSPEGQGIMGTWQNDHWDGYKNVAGRQTMWDKFTAEGVVHTVKQLSKTDPQIGAQYRSWIENEAGSQLYYKDFLNLNRYTGHDDVHFKFYDGANGGIPYIEALDGQGKPLANRPVIPGTYNTTPDVGHSPYVTQINQTVGRINSALAGMDRVNKGLGGDATSQLLSFLVRSQVDLGKNWEGLPKKIMDAISMSRGEQALKDMFQKQQENK